MATAVLRRLPRESRAGGLMLLDEEGIPRSGPYEMAPRTRFELDEVPFGAFGKLEVGAAAQPKPECASLMLQWCARQPRELASEERRRRCQAEHPEWFQPWTGLSLFDSSLRLPKATVMVRVVEDPVHIPENPPQVIMRRLGRAISGYPDAKVFYIEPFFQFPDDAAATPLVIGELNAGIDLQWAEIERKARRWGWAVRGADALANRIQGWIAERQAKKALRQRTEIYLDMLRRREAVGEIRKEKPKKTKAVDASGLTALDHRIRARREQSRARVVERETFTIDEASWEDGRGFRVPVGSSSAFWFHRMEGDELRADVETYRESLTAVGPMKAEEAEAALSRRQFNAAVMLGLVTFTGPKYMRALRLYDPLLLIQLNDEPFVRLIGHWDRWNVVEDGRIVRKTFVHI